jgi:predicted outer membrane lipoprotein
MTDRPGPQAGGFLIAIAIMAGTIIGGLMGQPSIGLLAGAAIGVIGAIALWLVDRKKAGR